MKALKWQTRAAAEKIENCTNGKCKRKRDDQNNAVKNGKLLQKRRPISVLFLLDRSFVFVIVVASTTPIFIFIKHSMPLTFFCGCSQKVALLNWSPHLQLYAWKPKKTTSSLKSCIALSLAWEKEKSPSVENAFLKFRVVFFSATAMLHTPEIFGRRAGKCSTWWLYLEWRAFQTLWETKI